MYIILIILIITICGCTLTLASHMVRLRGLRVCPFFITSPHRQPHTIFRRYVFSPFLEGGCCNARSSDKLIIAKDSPCINLYAQVLNTAEDSPYVMQCIRAFYCSLCQSVVTTQATCMYCIIYISLYAQAGYGIVYLD